jgi:hypothetical protein
LVKTEELFALADLSVPLTTITNKKQLHQPLLFESKDNQLGFDAENGLFIKQFEGLKVRSTQKEQGSV